MRRWSIRWLLLGVAAASLLLPLIALFSLRRFDVALIRQTERELNAQGALVAAHFQIIWAKNNGRPVGNPRARANQSSTFTPWTSRLQDLDRLAAPMPMELPFRPEQVPEPLRQSFEPLSQSLRTAQVFNLSGVRVLDAEGCTLASSRGQLDRCFAVLPEVRRALRGVASSALRERFSDEPKPALASIRRRGDYRVFVALPVHNNGEVIGALLLSRTAESGLEWLFKQRRDVFFGGLFVLALAASVSLGFSLLITRPLAAMKAKLQVPGVEDTVQLGALPAPAEIHTLGVALDQRAQQLATKSRYIADFAANVSHELKTPLTSIRGAVELLENAEMPDAQRRRFLSNIDAAAERTGRLVTRLLQLARLESQSTPADEEAVLLTDWARSLKERYADAVELDVGNAGEHHYPGSALESVVGNLVDNALRYRRQQPIKVGFTLASGQALAGEQLHISVRDDGPGIRKEDQKRLFERFFTTERDNGGTGLGLAIVLATAQSRGGQVQVTSDSAGTQVDVWM